MNPAHRTISFITLGCAKNEVDSERMQARLLAAGFTLTDDHEGADAIIINTCSFITEATEEAIATILEVAELESVCAGSARMIVTGCMPSRYGEELVAELPEVSRFVPCAQEENIVELVCEVLGLTCAAEGVPGTAGTSDTADTAGTVGVAGNVMSVIASAAKQSTARSAGTISPKEGFLRTTTAPWAYVKIADGCDRRCSYCTIPLIKGGYKSERPEDIVAEVTGLVAMGAREVILIAQDTGIWGHDLGGDRAEAWLAKSEGPDGPALRGAEVEPAYSVSSDDPASLRAEALPSCSVNLDDPVSLRDLPDLLDFLAGRFPTVWFRVMYLQPGGITDRLLDVMAKRDNICNYLDIPLQHANARILREMNRSGSAEEYLGLLRRIRDRLPGVALRTTLITGFPGESEADAAELEAFISEAEFDYVGVFAYSQEEGTTAGERNDQVPEDVRLARMQRLRDLADSIGFRKVAKRIQNTEEVLVSGYDEDEPDDPYPVLGRTRWQAPEVDGMVHLDRGNIGELLSATIVDAYCYELDGKVIH